MEVVEVTASQNKPDLAVTQGFLVPSDANRLYDALASAHHLPERQWPQSDFQLFGRNLRLPRLQTWHADEGIVYSYTNNLLTTRPWSPILTALRLRVEAATGHSFNAVLVNYYRDGRDYVGWHSDDDREMGPTPVIASVSLGAEREFYYRRKDDHECVGHQPLSHGSLLVMPPEFQHHWQHSVQADDSTTSRINCTFRYVYPKSS